MLIGWEVIAPAINFDLPDDIESISYPHLERSKINHWTDMIIKLRQDEILPQLFSRLETVLARGGRIWFIDAQHVFRPLDYRARDMVKDDPFKIMTVARTDQIRSWLLGHSTQTIDTRLAYGRDFSIILSVFSPPANTPEARAALLKPETLWKTVDPEENIHD